MSKAPSTGLVHSRYLDKCVSPSLFIVPRTSLNHVTWRRHVSGPRYLEKRALFGRRGQDSEHWPQRDPTEGLTQLADANRILLLMESRPSV